MTADNRVTLEDVDWERAIQALQQQGWPLDLSLALLGIVALAVFVKPTRAELQWLIRGHPDLAKAVGLQTLH